MHPLIGLSKTGPVRAEGTASAMQSTPVPTTTLASRWIGGTSRNNAQPRLRSAFIKQLGIGHQGFLKLLGDADNFPETLSPSKEIFDMLQDSHPKTLILTSLLSCRAKLVQDYPDYVDYVQEQGDCRTPLHLKIQLSHEMRLRDKSPAESLKNQ
jgi:hypothetical protein